MTKNKGASYAGIFLALVGLVGLLIILTIANGGKLTPMDVVKFWYGDAGVEASGLSESSTVFLVAFGMVLLTASGTIIALFQNRKKISKAF